jgi:hypothetical protein
VAIVPPQPAIMKRGRPTRDSRTDGVTARRWVAAAVLAAALVVAGWFGWGAWQRRQAGVAEPSDTVLVPEATRRGDVAETIETVDTANMPLPTGGTPMGERVAVLGLLNKRNGVSRDLTLKPGGAIRIGDAIVRLRACEKTAPWEADQLTGAFAQLDVRGADKHWRRYFSGWLFKERPALNVVQHPVYDVWVKSCAMTWPDTGPDTTTLSAPVARSSAKKSPGASREPEAAEAPTTPESASDSNTT